MSNKSEVGAQKKRTRVSQSEMPNNELNNALRIAQAIWENFAGQGGPPHQIAMALDMSPTSGTWRNLCGSSIAYGLTEGGYNANEIVLSQLGRRIVAPKEEGEDKLALRQAALNPRIMGEFFKQYDKAKFPRADIAANVLIDMGIPKERADQSVDMIKAIGEQVGFIVETTTGPFVAVDMAYQKDESLPHDEAECDIEMPNDDKLDEGHSIDKNSVVDSNGAFAGISNAVANDRVFITHGKNQKILDQIKQVVELGGFEPVISVRNETTAKPIPEKVMDDMRSCGAAVIHVGSEGTLTDQEGNPHTHINPNVLIEIGAAMALYKGRFILVVEEGVSLPSNLQGLYESRYSGSSLEFSAGMKILQAMRGMKAA